MATGPNSIQKLKKFYSRNVGDDFDQNEFSSELENESDRACVILVGSLLEDELLNLISVRLNLRTELGKDERNALFGPDGALGSFSKRISMAYAFQLITEEDRDQLTINREMRNACAHHMGPISFATPELVAVLRNLVHADNKPIIPAYEGDDPAELRYLFMCEALTLSVVLRTGDREATRRDFEQTSLSD